MKVVISIAVFVACVIGVPLSLMALTGWLKTGPVTTAHFPAGNEYPLRKMELNTEGWLSQASLRLDDDNGIWIVGVSASVERRVEAPSVYVRIKRTDKGYELLVVDNMKLPPQLSSGMPKYPVAVLHVYHWNPQRPPISILSWDEAVQNSD
jgi:hypothetical protein